jgi:hypothetical protein
MYSIRRLIGAVAALTGLALLVAGCGGVSPTTTTTGAAAGNGPPKDIAGSAYRYSACMRNHGVSNFPDPKVTTSGSGTQVAIMVPRGVGGTPQFNTAQTACKGILPQPSKSDLAAQAKQQEIHKQDLLAFAHCLRNHGVRGFPDPTSQGQLTLQMVQSAGIDLTAPFVRTAALTCVPASNGTITRAAVLQATSGNPQRDGSGSSASGKSP